MKNLKFWLVSIIIATLGTNLVWGQLYEVSLESRIHHSELIVEGKVVDAQSFLPEGAGNIFTAYLVEVQQILVGKEEPRYIQVLEKGGVLDGRIDWVSHRAPISIGLRGIFFCRKSGRTGFHFPETKPVPYELYAGAQGIITIEKSENKLGGRDVFHRYPDIQANVFELIKPGTSPIKQEAMDSHGSTIEKQGTLTISGFFPTSITGGTRSVLSISGTDFGTTAGTVSFYNTDNGGVPLWIPTDPADILSWEDTLITCWLPSMGPYGDFFRGVPGTGPIKVETFTGDSTKSLDTLDILYSVRNFRTIVDSTANYFFLMDTNGTGGYTFQYSQSFNDSTKAVGVFEKSLKEWRCNSGVNFVIGNPTLKNVAIMDGTSIVKWNDDSSDSLRAGELAFTIVRADPCVDGNTLESIYFVYEIDMVFKDSTTIFIDSMAPPPATKFDFYTITLHELGHAHLLNHVVVDSSLMFYGTSLGRSARMIDADQLAGASWVMGKSTIGHPFCPSTQSNPTPMISVPNADCNIIDGIEEDLFEIDFPNISIYPNPTSGDSYIRINGNNTCSSIIVTVFDPLGKVVYSNSLKNNPGDLNVFTLENQFLNTGINMIKITVDGETFGKLLIKD